MSKPNPFKDENGYYGGNGAGKEKVRDPLDVCELLTDSTRTAVITTDGELKLQKQNPKGKPKVELMKERYWGRRPATLKEN